MTNELIHSSTLPAQVPQQPFANCTCGRKSDVSSAGEFAAERALAEFAVLLIDSHEVTE
jgi:hypothetical protein